MNVLKILRDGRIFFEKQAFALMLKFYGAEYRSFRVVGIPFLSVAKGGKLSVGDGLRINSRPGGNVVGGTSGTVIRVEKNACLKIGKNVGISSAVIVATSEITIEDNVKIGGGAYILDSDFHSLAPEDRLDREHDMRNAKSSPVHIKENALLGARCMILKGCTVGRNSVVGAGSVVTRSVPDNEIWAGNPARPVRRIMDYSTEL